MTMDVMHELFEISTSSAKEGCRDECYIHIVFSGSYVLPTILCFVRPTLWSYSFIMYISHISRSLCGSTLLFSSSFLVWKF